MKTKRVLFFLVILVTISSLIVAPAKAQSPQGCPAKDPSGEIQILPVKTTLGGWVCSATGKWVPAGSEEQQTQGQPAAPQSAATQPAAPTSEKVINGQTPIVGTVFQTPVQSKKSFNPQTKWIVSEEGVILDASATFTRPELNSVYTTNLPEGGFWYGSMSQGKLTFFDGSVIDMQYVKNNNYLVLVRGKISDGIVDSDLNTNIKVEGFVTGHAIWSPMPPAGDSAAYVSHDWFRQQLTMSTKSGGTNCGSQGCSLTTIILYDVTSHAYQKFTVNTGNVDNWTMVEGNFQG